MHTNELHAPSKGPESFSRTRYRSLRPDEPEEPIFGGYKHIEDFVAEESQHDEACRQARVHEVVVRRAYDGRENKRWVSNPHDNKE